MKRLHLVTAKSLDEVEKPIRGKLLPVLENETLAWAKQKQSEAHRATVKIQEEYQKNPNSVSSKYFKYLRRLYELKLEDIEATAFRENRVVTASELNKELMEWLKVESLRIPEALSCTQLGLYKKCPRKWYYQYGLGIKFPKTSALHFGSAVDEALNFYFDEKINKRIPPRSAVHACFVEHFQKDRETVRWGNDKPELLLKNGPVIIDTYLNNFDRITDPIEIQTECKVHLDNGGLLIGYIDILEEKAIVDTKTASKKWEDTGRFAKHLEEMQPKAYSLWYLEHYERMPEEFRYQIVTKETDENGVAKPQTQLISFELKKFELEAFRRFVQKVWDEIMENLPKGISGFPASAEPGPEDGYGLGKKNPDYLCNFQHCDYAAICEKQGLRIPQKWVSKTKDQPGYFVYGDEK